MMAEAARDGLRAKEVCVQRALFCGVLASLSVAGVAQATGICENNPRRYRTEVSYSPQEGRVATAATQAWCEEKERDGVLSEQRGTVPFVEIRDRKGTVIERLSGATGAQAARLKEYVGDVTSLSDAALVQQLRSRGFVPLPERAVSPSGACSVRSSWKKSDTRQNGFPAGQVSVDVLAGHTRLASIEVDVLAAHKRRTEVALRAMFLPSERALLLWLRLPQCEGPPPGYFGKGDPGTCYPIEQLVLKLLSVADQPALSACFDAASPVPTIPPPT